MVYGERFNEVRGDKQRKEGRKYRLGTSGGQGWNGGVNTKFYIIK
jgi:hypothetical protein